MMNIAFLSNLPRTIFVLLSMTGICLADEQGFIDNWPGEIKLEFGAPQLVPLPPGSGGPSFSERFRLAWVDIRPTICNKIQAAFAASGEVREWRSCDLPLAGELRGRVPNSSFYPNRLDLKYLVSGARVQFRGQSLPVLADVQIQGSFDMAINLALEFKSRLDAPNMRAAADLDVAAPDSPGTRYVSDPISLRSGSITFANAHLKSNHDGTPGISGIIAPKLRAAEAQLNARVEDIPENFLSLRSTNIEIYKGANQFRAAFDNENNRTPYLNLVTALKENVFIVKLWRAARPGVALPDIRCVPECNSQIGCNGAGASIIQEDERIVMQRLATNGNWAPIGASDPGIWWVKGDASGVADNENITLRLCTVNNWGENCGRPISFVYRRVGACPPPSPTRPRHCPVGEIECVGRGCRPSEQCDFQR